MNPPGISIVSHAPLWSDSSEVWKLTEQVHNYSHIIEALGGYWSADFTIRGARGLMDDWLQDGLGRHVQVYDDSLTCIWEGFVNAITANYGPLAITRGPLLDIANRVSITYSGVAYDEDDNPIFGTSITTAEEDDTDSQALWGIVPIVLSTGSAVDADAEDIRDTYLEQHKMPRTSKQWRSDASGETSVEVSCLGYVHWLNWPYNTVAVGGEENTSAKIVNVLADTPNVAWLAFDTTNVTENTLQVPAWEDENNLAWSVIKGIVARGDATLNRWLFGVYADLEAYYVAAPTTLEYQQRLSQPRTRIEHAGGDEVYPWNVLPGKWMLLPDFLIGQAAELNLRDDPRAMFIEQVQYTAPWELELKGGAIDTVAALVAQLGLSGIGA